MEHISMVRTAQNKNLYRETYWPFYYYDKISKIKYAAQLLFVLGFGSFGMYLMLTNWSFVSVFFHITGVMICVALLYCVYCLIFCAYVFAQKEDKKRKKFVGDRQVYVDIMFYDSYFCVYSAISSAKETVSYTDILSLDDTKHYYIIRTKVGAVAFDKNGFIDGTCEQTVQLLCEKGNIT